jgi:hypothetical protein
MKKILVSILSLIVIYAGGKEKIGTAGAQLLQLNTTPVNMALGGTNYASVTGINSIYTNPAGLARMETSMEVHVSTVSWLADTDINQLLYAFKVGEYTTLGLSFRSLNVGDIDVTTTESSNGTGETLNPSNTQIGLTYSQKFTDRISFGATISYYSEDYGLVQASAVAADLGIQYRTETGLDFGIALKNVGTDIAFDGNAKSLNNGSDRTPYYLSYENSFLPTEFKISVNYVNSFSAESNLTILSDFTNFNQGVNSFAGGVEYAYNNMFYARASYRLYQEDDVSAFDGLNFGLGVNFSMDEATGSNVMFNYSYQGVDESAFDAVNSLGVTLTF